jgi:CHAT domain-containing protein
MTSWTSTAKADTQIMNLHACHYCSPAPQSWCSIETPDEEPRNGPLNKPIQDRLTVRQISEMYLPHAHLAYLSACSTAENSATRLLDEVIHLVSGFQVAGFGHVIGSMWPSADGVCAEVARDFYMKLSQEDKLLSENGSIASALQSSVIKARERYWREPLLWAQYVHFGA